MPHAALSPCRTCRQVGCTIHPRQPWQAMHVHAGARVRGRKLQRLRAQLFDREPLCRLCAATGRTTIATIRDHIVPLAEGGLDRDDNVQPLCQRCSDVKTEAESKRGVRRWGGV